MDSCSNCHVVQAVQPTSRYYEKNHQSSLTIHPAWKSSGIFQFIQDINDKLYCRHLELSIQVLLD